MGIQVSFKMPENATLKHEIIEAYGERVSFDYANHPDWKHPLYVFDIDGQMTVVSDFNHWGSIREWLYPWLKENNIEFSEF